MSIHSKEALKCSLIRSMTRSFFYHLMEYEKFYKRGHSAVINFSSKEISLCREKTETGKINNEVKKFLVHREKLIWRKCEKENDINDAKDNIIEELSKSSNQESQERSCKINTKSKIVI